MRKEFKKGDTSLPEGRGHTKDEAKYLYKRLKELGNGYFCGW
ncbi:MAG: hypothetical protein BWY36_00960 [Candidatus Diapherotrites archaeon ADurb.Bin253]|jgi:hypothetical protein|nr:MAG: hypothetical protein BWY36_00960 [Candidatus Diapherotrites archaeon ADurb.Bin253]